MNDFTSDKAMSSMTVEVKAAPIDATLERMRAQGTIVGFGDVLLHAIAQALQKFPEFNSHFDTELHTYPTINIGYFINLGQGSKLAVLKDAGKLSLEDFAKQVKQLALQYIRNELDDNLADSTVAITNIAAFNVQSGHNPIYDHHAAMISIFSQFESAEFVDGKFVPIKKFNMTLSYDVNVASCQKAVEFLNHVKSLVETSEQA